jgi:hypothetical protein
MHILPGGATRSEKAPRYDLIPIEGLERIAERFSLGAEKHGEGNWKQSLATESNAYAFCKEAFNHAIHHANKMVSGIDPEDDHLGAIGWFVVVTAHVEEKFGKKWTHLSRGLVDELGL